MGAGLLSSSSRFSRRCGTDLVCQFISLAESLSPHFYTRNLGHSLGSLGCLGDTVRGKKNKHILSAAHEVRGLGSRLLDKLVTESALQTRVAGVALSKNARMSRQKRCGSHHPGSPVGFRIEHTLGIATSPLAGQALTPFPLPSTSVVPAKLSR